MVIHTTYDVFASVRTRAMRVRDEAKCIDLAVVAARSMPRTWGEYIASLDWFLTYYGRRCALED